MLRLPLAPAADPTFGVQRAALTPRGMLDEEDCFWLPLGWSCDGPRWAPLLLMMLRLAAASSTAELIAAMTAAAGGGGDEEGEEAEADVDIDEVPALGWSLLAEACDADLAGSAPQGDGDDTVPYWPHGAASVASAARRDLVLAYAEVAWRRRDAA